MEEERGRVMVWGGSRGLGKEIARESVRRGHVTWITGRDPRKAMDDPELAGIAKCDLAHFEEVGTPGDRDTEKVGRDFYAHSLNADILFWVVGHWLRKPFERCTPKELAALMNVHLTVPMLRLRYVLEHRLAHGQPPPHLVVISSSSAWKGRDDGQAAYGAVQSAKVQFARNLHAELARFFPARTTIVRPGGMKTEFFAGSGVDTAHFADPSEVAAAIWSRVDLRQRPPLLEMDVFQKDGRLLVECTPHDPLAP